MNMINLKMAAGLTMLIGGVFVGITLMTLGAGQVGMYLQCKYGIFAGIVGAAVWFLLFLFLTIWGFLWAMEAYDRWF